MFGYVELSGDICTNSVRQQYQLVDFGGSHGSEY